MSSCQAIAKRVLPKDTVIRRVEDLGKNCLVDFYQPKVRSSVEYAVDCDSQCDGNTSDDEKEYGECVKSCEDTVRRSTVGSLVFDKKTLSISEGTIPVEAALFHDEDSGEFAFNLEGRTALIVKKALAYKGCVPMQIGWMHPHEFMADPQEVEEDPAIGYIHPKLSVPGTCRVPDVMQILDADSVRAQTDLRKFL